MIVIGKSLGHLVTLKKGQIFRSNSLCSKVTLKKGQIFGTKPLGHLVTLKISSILHTLQNLAKLVILLTNGIIMLKSHPNKKLR